MAKVKEKNSKGCKRKTEPYKRGTTIMISTYFVQKLGSQRGEKLIYSKFQRKNL